MPSLIRSKSGIYYVVSSQNGKRIWRSTGTRKRAEAVLRLTTTPPPKPRSRASLSSCIADYLPHVETNFARKTHQVYALTLKHFKEFTGDVEIHAIQPQVIDAYKVHRARRVAPATVNIELCSLKAFFNTLKRWQITGENPCEGIQQIRLAEQPPIFFTETELKILVESISDPWLRGIVVFAVMTGARLGEVLNVTWKDVDLQRRSLVIRSSEAYRVKGGKVRIIPMNQSVHSLLSGMSYREGLVFKGMRGGRANPNFVSEKFREAVRKLSFGRRLHFHSLRHTFASLLVQKGASLYHVQKLLGHSSIQMTEKYSHAQVSEMQEVVNVIALPEFHQGVR